MTALHGERPCLIVGCTRPLAADDRFCAPHRYWANYVLSRPYYRDHEPPDVEANGTIQEPLEALLSPMTRLLDAAPEAGTQGSADRRSTRMTTAAETRCPRPHCGEETR